MNLIGKFKEITKDFLDNTVTISFTCSDVSVEDMENLKGDDLLRITVKKHRKHRSLDANAYYWVLVGKIADKLKISKPYCHNVLLRRYGQTEMFENQIAYTMLPDTDDTTNRIDNMEECHFAPTSIIKTGKDGIMYRAYKLLKPSHTLDSKDFSTLIDGAVDEAKNLGIPTMSEEEIKRMVGRWKA